MGQGCFFVFFLLCHSDDVAEKKGQRRILSSDEDARKIKQGLILDIPPRGMKTKSLWETRERERMGVWKKLMNYPISAGSSGNGRSAVLPISFCFVVLTGHVSLLPARK